MVLIVSAFSHELTGISGLVRQSSPSLRWIASASIRESAALLVANGVGRRAAASATRRALSMFRFDAIVSAGYAGALDPSLTVGDILLAGTVRCGPREYPALRPAACPAGVRRGTLLTVDRVVQSAPEKRMLARCGAAAVDMESAAVAAVAAERGLAFFCVRSISDRADQDLPVDFNRALRQDGTPSPWILALQVALSPGSWRRLPELWRGTRLASRSLARFLQQCKFQA